MGLLDKVSLGAKPADVKPANVKPQDAGSGDKPKDLGNGDTVLKNNNATLKANDKGDTITMTNTMFSDNNALGGKGNDKIVQGSALKDGGTPKNNDSHNNNNTAEGGDGSDAVIQTGDNSVNRATESNDGSGDVHTQIGNHQDNYSDVGDGNNITDQEGDWNVDTAVGGTGDDAYVQKGNNNEFTINDAGGNNVAELDGSGNKIAVTTGDGNDNIALNTNKTTGADATYNGGKNTGTIDVGKGDNTVTVGTQNGPTDVTIKGDGGNNTLNFVGNAGDWKQSTDSNGNTVYTNGDSAITVDKGANAKVNYVDKAPDQPLPDGAGGAAASGSGQQPGTTDTSGTSNDPGAQTVATDLATNHNDITNVHDPATIKLSDGSQFTGNVVQHGGSDGTGYSSANSYYEVQGKDGKSYYALYNDTTAQGTGGNNPRSVTFSGTVLTKDDAIKQGILNADGTPNNGGSNGNGDPSNGNGNANNPPTRTGPNDANLQDVTHSATQDGNAFTWDNLTGKKVDSTSNSQLDGNFNGDNTSINVQLTDDTNDKGSHILATTSNSTVSLGSNNTSSREAFTVKGNNNAVTINSPDKNGGGGDVNRISGNGNDVNVTDGDGEDSVTLKGDNNKIGNISTGNDNDTVRIDGNGNSGNIDLGDGNTDQGDFNNAGNNLITNGNNNNFGSIKAGSGHNFFDLGGNNNTYGSLTTGDDGTMFRMHGDGNKFTGPVKLGGNGNIVTVDGNNNDLGSNFTAGSGDNDIRIGGNGNKGTINSGDGQDNYIVTGGTGTDIKINAGGGDDHLQLQGNEKDWKKQDHYDQNTGKLVNTTYVNNNTGAQVTTTGIDSVDYSTNPDDLKITHDNQTNGWSEDDVNGRADFAKSWTQDAYRAVDKNAPSGQKDANNPFYQMWGITA